jgi:hypothetical protein
MEGIAAGLHGQVHQLARIEITLERIAADAMGFIGTFHVERLAIGIGIDRHRANTHLGAGPYDTHGDLASIGNKYLLDHTWLLVCCNLQPLVIAGVSKLRQGLSYGK